MYIKVENQIAIGDQLKKIPKNLKHVSAFDKAGRQKQIDEGYYLLEIINQPNEFQHITGHTDQINAAAGKVTRTNILVETDLAQLKSRQIIKIKNAARAKILAIASERDQLNLFIRYSELIDIIIGDGATPGRKLNPAEATERKEIQNTWSKINAIRDKSKAAAALVNTKTNHKNVIDVLPENIFSD